ncbi:MAG TPA: DUF559 domain-containing protein [Nitrospirae bacterium]|nr:DUF559 domain-containing protein [Nitrospirota bacterium]HDY70595.1 DUF559 domain-containing protein [Nitrospirota bacterium]
MGDHDLNKTATSLRKRTTRAEEVLWLRLRSRQSEGLKFRMLCSLLIPGPAYCWIWLIVTRWELPVEEMLIIEVNLSNQRPESLTVICHSRNPERFRGMTEKQQLSDCIH